MNITFSTTRKLHTCRPVLATAALALVLAFAGSAGATAYTKADNSTAMNVTTSWTPNGSPGASDTVSWTGSYSALANLGATFGAATSWQGITVGNISGADAGLVSLGGTGVSASQLTIGSSGLDMSGANQNVVLNSTILNLNVSQTWNIASGKNVRIGTSGTGAANGKLVGSLSTAVITISGSGAVDCNQGGGSGYSDANSFVGYLGKWQVNSGATLMGIRNGSTAWGANTSADAILLNGGKLAVGGLVSGTQGNWAWNTEMTLADGTTSIIDNQIYASGSSRWLKLEGAIAGGSLNTGNLTFNNTSTTTFSSDDYGFILSGANTFNGTLTINASTYVRVGGSAAGSADANAGNNGSVSSTSPITDNGVLRLTRNDTWTLANTISGSGLVKVGGTVGTTTSQIVTLSGASSFSGAVTVINGTLKLGAAGSGANSPLGTTAGATTVNSGAVLDLNGFTLATAEPLTLNGTGISSGGALVNSSSTAATYSGLITLGSASSIVAASGNIVLSAAGTITGSGYGLTLDGTATGSSLASIIGTTSGTLTKSGTGTWTLSGANTYTGGTTLSAGQLNINSTTALGATASTLTISGASTIDNTSVGDITLANNNAQNWNADFTYAGSVHNLNLGTGAVALGASRQVTVTAGTLTVGGGIGGSTFGLTKAGNGTLTLANGSTYTGSTTVSAGNLLVNGTATASSSYTVNGGTLGGIGTLSGVTVNSGGTITAGNASGVGGNLSMTTLTFGTGSSTVNVNPGSAILAASGALTANGTTTINVSGTGVSAVGVYHLITYTGSTVSSGFVLGTLPLRVVASLQFNAGSIDLNVTGTDSPKWSGATSAAWDTATTNWKLVSDGVTGTTYIDGTPGDKVLFDDTASGNFAVTLANTYTPASVTVNNSSTTYSLSGSGKITGATTSLTKNGTGTFTLGTVNDYAGGTTVSAGTLALGAANALPTAGAVALTGTLDLNANSQQVAALTGAGNVANTGGGMPTLTIANTSADTFGGVIADGTGTTALTKSGGGTLTLNNNSTFSGTTTISAGTLSVGAGSTTGAIGGGTIANSGTLQINRSDTVTLANTITGSGTVSIVGNGDTTISSSLGGSVSVTGNGNDTISAAISGSGTVSQSGTGTLNLNGANTYSGGTTLSAGTLTLGNTTAIGATTSTLTITGGSLDSAVANLVNANSNVQNWNGDFTFAGSQNLNLGTGAVALGANRQVTVNANTLTVGGIVSGGYSLTKVGAGTLLLSGVNTYSGGTVIAGGTVKLGNATGISKSGSYGGTLTVQNGIVDVNGQQNYANVNQSGAPNIWLTTATVTLGGTAGTANIADTGATPLGIAFANSSSAITYNAKGNPGMATVSARWGQMGSSNPGTRVISITNSPTSPIQVDFTGGWGDTAAWDGRSATIQKTGAGTVRMSGPNNFSGLQITAGTFICNNAQALGADRTASSGMVNLLTVDGGTVDLNGFNETVSGLSDNSVTTGVILNNGGSASTLTVGSSGANTTYGGTIMNGSSAIGITKTGSGTLTLSGANTYTGGTTISAGTLALGATGSINNSPNLNLAAGATLDVSAINAFTLSSSTTLNAAGANSAATIKGASGGTVNLGSQPVVLTDDGTTSHPALTISQGTLVLGNNSLTVNSTLPLASGIYTLVSQASGSITAGGTLTLNAASTAIDSTHYGTLSVSAGNVNLTVALKPTVTGKTYSRAPGVAVKIYDSDLASTATVDGSLGYTPTFDHCDSTTANSVTLGNNGQSGNTAILVYPGTAANSSDSFSYTIHDGHGGTASGTVTISINNNVTGQATINVAGQAATLSFFGVPGYHYVVQRSVNSLNNWQDLTSVTTSDVTPGGTSVDGNGVITAPSGGAFIVTDSSPSSNPDSVFYQLRAAP